MAVDWAKLYSPGESVPSSGIYKVVHDTEHTEEHEVTCVYGKRFPPCNHCGENVRFKALKIARHIETNENFT